MGELSSNENVVTQPGFHKCALEQYIKGKSAIEELVMYIRRSGDFFELRLLLSVRGTSASFTISQS